MSKEDTFDLWVSLELEMTAFVLLIHYLSIECPEMTERIIHDAESCLGGDSGCFMNATRINSHRMSMMVGDQMFSTHIDGEMCLSILAGKLRDYKRRIWTASNDYPDSDVDPDGD